MLIMDTRHRNIIIITIIFLVLFISALIYGIFLYMDLNEKRTEGFQETERELLKQTNLTEVFKIENFNGEEPYHVVYGKTENGENEIVFYPLEGTEKTITTVKATEIISDGQMIDIWKSDCNECDLIKITPALIGNEILWELVYYDENNRYVFDYRSIYDGSHFEDIRYLRKFN